MKYRIRNLLGDVVGVLSILALLYVGLAAANIFGG